MVSVRSHWCSESVSLGSSDSVGDSPGGRAVTMMGMDSLWEECLPMHTTLW